IQNLRQVESAVEGFRCLRMSPRFHRPSSAILGGASKLTSYLANACDIWQTHAHSGQDQSAVEYPVAEEG
ncbi:MAG: hypothetical protein O7G83_19665, partial [Proteobacteria bacterium]|nr:hypothetical protein [Pseudomonadota bacterium]